MPSLDFTEVEVDPAVMGAGLGPVSTPLEQAVRITDTRATQPNRSR